MEDRLGGSAFFDPYIEEWKATVTGMVGNFLIPYDNYEASLDDLKAWLLRHIVEACRYAKGRNHPFGAAYFRKSMMLMKVAEETGVLYCEPQKE